MKNIFQVLFLFTLLFGAGVIDASAQEIALNNEGQLIIRYKDGSFKFVQEKDLTKNFLKTVNSKIVQNYFLGRAESYVEYIEDSKNFLDLDILYGNSELEDLKLNKDDYKEEIKIQKKKIKALQKQLKSIDALLDEAKDNLTLVKKFKLKKPKKMASAIKEYLSKEISEDDWQKLYHSKMTYSEFTNNFRDKNIKEEEPKEETTEVPTSTLKEEAPKSNDIITTAVAKKEEQTTKELKNISNIVYEEYKEETSTKKPSLSSPQKDHFSYTILPTDRQYKSYDQENNLLVYPPGYKCPIRFDGMDEITGNSRKDLKPELIFTYTPPKLERILKGKDYMVCRGHFSKVTGGFRFLFLEIKIKSRTALIEYGQLDQGNLLSLKLLDGKIYKVRSSVSGKGIYDEKTGYTTYKTQYKLTSDLNKKLKSSPLDKIRIIWSTGYEDYEVYNIDFLSNQLNCL